MTKLFIVLSAVLIVLSIALNTEPPACAKRMAAQGLTGVCVGN